jgi:phage-related protein
VIDTTVRIVNAIQAIFSGSDSKYEEAGRKVARSFESGLSAQSQSLVNTVNRVIESVHALFNGVSLYSEGAAITKSLESGIQSRVGVLTKILQTITAMIPTVKGPMERDKKLLYANGVAIMNGLIAGIGSQRSALLNILAGVTDDITGGLGLDSSGEFGSKPTSTNPLPYTYVPGGGVGGSMNQSITINTPEIVPARDAALLGFELSRRVG